MVRKCFFKVFNCLKNIRGIFNRNKRSKQLVLTGIVLFVTFSLALIVPSKITETISNHLSQNPSVVEKGERSNSDEWEIEWEYFHERVIGTTHANWVEETSDGYILAGYSRGSVLDIDGILVKVDENGEKEWSKGYPETGLDGSRFYCAKETSDGGYIATGSNGELSFAGVYLWLVKTNANGEKTWSQTYGKSMTSSTGRFIDQASTGGYIVVGDTKAYGAGGYDVWMIKTDSSGEIDWSYTYGSTKDDYARCVKKTSDGGYIITGYYTTSSGDYNVFLLKIDRNGNFVWDNYWGGLGDDQAKSVVETSDGGYLIAGTTRSYGSGGDDVWLIKTNANGNEVWKKTYGGTGSDSGSCVEETADGGYMITGSTNSSGSGGFDAWLIKTYANGSEEWSKTFGSSDDDYGRCVQQTEDGNYIIAGNKGEKAWLAKISYGVGDENIIEKYLIDNELVMIGLIGLAVGLIVYSIIRKGKLEPEELGE
ncbi:MAG: hypothetical protein Q6362_004420 [Candidatus Wukongarchaeota archaeon]|nr:hypothetical protein [Candidatus Wukongarchaeota archaeon]MDO8128676.1 hypothetical protein [Candidatus Wukongarchaeota archaeon]